MTDKGGKISVAVLIFLLIMALFAPLIANDLPLRVCYGENRYYPAIAVFFGNRSPRTIETPSGTRTVHYQRFHWQAEDWESVVMPVIPFAPDQLDASRSGLVKPGENGHMLGTDRLGRDVAAGLVHGARISLSIGWIAMGIAALIGVLLGGISGYWGNRRWRVPRLSFQAFWMFLPLGYFYAVHINLGPPPVDASLLLVIPFGGAWLLGQIPAVRRKTMSVPLDGIITRITEILTSLPRLLIIITVASIVPQGIWIVMAVIGLTGWTHIARYTRAEVLRIRSLDYITAVEAAGIKPRRILLRHVLPNVLAPVWVNMAFGIASAILIESGLSFLGIGVPIGTVTWGSMLNAGRIDFEAWWLVLFPGMAIFVTVTAYNLLGESLRKWLQPKESAR